MTPNELETLHLLLTETGTRFALGALVLLGPWVAWDFCCWLWRARRT